MGIKLLEVRTRDPADQKLSLKHQRTEYIAEIGNGVYQVAVV